MKQLLFGIALLVSTASADITIHEISAASSERLLRYDEQGRPRLGAGLGFMDRGYDDSRWESGAQPFGFGFAGVETDLEEAMEGVTPSLYLRKTFTVNATTAAMEVPLQIKAKFNDAFVAYINGIEIGRGNLGRANSFVYHDQSSYNEQSDADSTKEQRIDGPVASEVLVEGENVLAIQVHNRVIQHISENSESVDDTLYFDASFSIGRGIFVDGTTATPIANESDVYRYWVGMAEPAGGLADVGLSEESGFSDWIELHNSGDEIVDLSGWTLSDQRDPVEGWPFPDGTSISPNGFLVVLADALNVGGSEGDYLHTNFKLSADGEYLGLHDSAGVVVSQFDDGYPKQDPFHSYGWDSETETFRYFDNPTPGATNGSSSLEDRVKAPKFSVEGGFHDNAIELTLESSTEGAEIRYTLDGSLPEAWNGEIYQSPISIKKIDEKTGTVVRTRAFKEGMISSKPKTRTYLIGQDAALQSVPAISLVADGGRSFYSPHGVMALDGGSGLGEAWRSTNIQDYFVPQMHGRPYEKPTSVEILYPDEEGGHVQLDAGIRLAGSNWSRPRYTLADTDDSPWASRPQEKPSFNLFFRGDYDGVLDFPLVKNYPVRTFEQLRMRAGKNDIRNPWIRDELTRRLFSDMGQLSAVGIQNALYLNGVYKGYFNTVSRLRSGLFQEFYGGDGVWDIRHIGNWTSGDGALFDQTIDLLERDLDNLENWQTALKWVDPINIADYLIVNSYTATWDWPHNNFVIARERSDAGRWRMHVWDAEGTFGHNSNYPVTRDVLDVDIINNNRGPIVQMSKLLLEAPEFRIIFADRLNAHFFSPSGALTPDNILQRKRVLADEIEPLMRFTGNGGIQEGSFDQWVKAREKNLFKEDIQYRAAGVWPETQAPKFNQHGGTVAAGFELRITVGSIFEPQAGDLLFTTDGTDPRIMGGAVNPSATVFEKTDRLALHEVMTVKARVLNGEEWSAMTEATFLVDLALATSDSLVISEILFDPAEASEEEKPEGFKTSDFEFLEFYNASDIAIDLSPLSFDDGIRFDFSSADESTIAPKSYLVIVANRDAFVQRYGGDIAIGGDYGQRLNNSGETLEIIHGTSGEVVKSLTYTATTEQGFALVLNDPDNNPNPSDPANWSPSAALGGSPGAAIGSPVPDSAYDQWSASHFTEAELADESISGPNSDPDGDSQTNLMEFAFATLPKDRRSTSALEFAWKNASTFTVSATQRKNVEGLVYTLEWSNDLNGWDPAGDAFVLDGTLAIGEDLNRVTFRSNEDALGGFVRWHVTLN